MNDKKHDSKINESPDINDPVLVAFRAAKMNREKELAKPKRKPLYGKQRQRAEDVLWNISRELKELYAERGQILIDMEQEAEIEGGSIADEYGDRLNKIEDRIQKLLSNRKQLEMKLAESKEIDESCGCDHSNKQNLKEFDLTDISVWEAIFAGGLFEVGRMAVDVLVAIGFIALSGISLSAALLINKVRQVRKDRRAIKGAKEAQDWLASTPEMKAFNKILADVERARTKMAKTKRPIDGGDDAAYKNATDAFKSISDKRKTTGLSLYKKAVNAGLSNEALEYLVDNIEYMSVAKSMYDRRTTNEGIMSELDLMAQEASDFNDFINDVFSDPAYRKHKGNQEVMDFLDIFYKERRGAVSEQSNILVSRLRKIILEEYIKITEAKRINRSQTKIYEKGFKEAIPSVKWVKSAFHRGEPKLFIDYSKFSDRAKLQRVGEQLGLTYVADGRVTNRPGLDYNRGDRMTGGSGTLGIGNNWMVFIKE